MSHVEGRPSLAAVTMVRDEKIMLPRWISHYSRECGGPEHLYVLDDNSSDGSTDDLPCSVTKLADWGSQHFERTRMKLITEFAADLHASYDAVLFADADEFLVADPERHEDLRGLVAARTGKPVIGAMNLNVVHDATREPPLDPDRPVLGQRTWAKFVPLMCKPALRTRALPWVAGSHGTTVPFEIDPDLYMFHLKFAERDHLKAVGDHRKDLADREGRAKETSWQFAGDDLVALLDEVVATADPAEVKPFRPRPQVLEGIVRAADNGTYRAHGRRQVKAMQRQPMVRVPKRFWGLA